MKFKSIQTIVAIAAMAIAAPAATAAGMIVVDPIVGGVVPRPVPVTRPGHRPPVVPTLLKGQVSFGLRLQDAEVKVDITDQVAKTYITQTFVNDTDQNLAGTYLFPLPEDTTFSSFSLHIDGKPIEGQTYEDIVRRMVDPGLLEFADYKTVRARIFPIPAHGTKKVELEYTQVLKAENGMIKYRFPLKTEAEAGSTEDVKIGVKVNSKSNIRTIWSPSHDIASKRDGEHKALISFAGKDVLPDKDFLLYYSVSDKDLTANLLTQKSSGEDGYFLMTLTPPVEAKQVVGKDIVLVADTSGSMKGQRMDQTKKALKYLVNALNPSDNFSVVRFSTDVDSFKPTLVAASPENKKAAVEFIDDMEAAGGTNIGDALKTASTLLGGPPANQRPAYMVMMTDGEPTVGETTVAGLLKTVGTKRDIRVFDFGVGYDLNTRLLNKLAEQHHGTAQYVEPNENIEVELSNFYDKIKSPVLSDIKITYNGITVKDVYPRNVKDIFAGNQLMLMGKYKGAGAANVQLTGTINGTAKTYSFPLTFEEAQSGHGYLPRLWAMRRIGHLTEIAQENGDNKEVVDEIIELSKKYGIISAYTSFLVTDPSENGRLANVATPMIQMRRGSGGLRAPASAPAFDMEEGSSFGFAGPAGSRRTSSRVGGKATLMARIPSTKAGGAFYSAPQRAQIVDERPTVTDFRESASGPTSAALPPTGAAYGSSGVDLFAGAGGEGAGGAGGYLASKFKSESVSGESAVRNAKEMNKLKDSVAYYKPTEKQDAGLKTVDEKTFFLRDGFWTDSQYNSAKSPKLEVITFGTQQYFDLLKTPGISKYLAVGRQVILVYNGHSYKIVFKADA
jgi:Ca-activated chloride channel homolog